MRLARSHGDVRLLQVGINLTRQDVFHLGIRTISRNSAIAKGLRSDPSAYSRPRQPFSDRRPPREEVERQGSSDYQGRPFRNNTSQAGTRPPRGDYESTEQTKTTFERRSKRAKDLENTDRRPGHTTSSGFNQEGWESQRAPLWDGDRQSNYGENTQRQRRTSYAGDDERSTGFRGETEQWSTPAQIADDWKRTSDRNTRNTGASANTFNQKLPQEGSLPVKFQQDDGVNVTKSADIPLTNVEQHFESVRPPSRQTNKESRRTKGLASDPHATKSAKLYHLKSYFPKQRQEFETSQLNDAPRRKKTKDPDIESWPVPVPYVTAASEIIGGVRAVKSIFLSSRRKIHKLYLADNKTLPLKHPEHAETVQMARKAGIPVEVIDYFLMDKWTMVKEGMRATVHDGILVDASPIAQTPITALGFTSRHGDYFQFDLAPQSKEEAEVNGVSNRAHYSSDGWRQPFLIWLHGVVSLAPPGSLFHSLTLFLVNVGNLGAILRTALYFGADGIILSKRETVGLSSTTIRTSAGAADFLPFFTMMTEPMDFLKASKNNGWRFYATVAPDSAGSKPRLTLHGLTKSPLHDAPCVLILGNEDDGLQKWLIKAANHNITITAQSSAAKSAQLDSLNVSVAGALFMEKFLRKPVVAKALVGGVLEPSETKEEVIKEDDPMF